MLAARVAHPLVSSSLRRASGGFVGTSAATLVEESPSLIQGLLLQIARGPGPGGRGLRERVMSAAAGSGQAPSPPSSTTWEGAASQEEFMAKDTCILLDDADKVIGSASKKECHTFRADQPQGLLHRAFSVFLFNERNELLLQKRASSKVRTRPENTLPTHLPPSPPSQACVRAGGRFRIRTLTPRAQFSSPFPHSLSSRVNACHPPPPKPVDHVS